MKDYSPGQIGYDLIFIPPTQRLGPQLPLRQISAGEKSRTIKLERVILGSDIFDRDMHDFSSREIDLTREVEELNALGNPDEDPTGELNPEEQVERVYEGSSEDELDILENLIDQIESE